MREVVCDDKAVICCLHSHDQVDSMDTMSIRAWRTRQVKENLDG